MKMKQYNWIKAYYASQNDDREKEIFVRQEVEHSETFVDEKGNRYHISELDLTRDTFEPQIIPIEKTDSLKWLLESMDANAIADHKAKIDEREYWRKLRGDIALEIIRKRGDKGHYDTACHYAVIAEMTKVLFNELYAQDAEFFKDK